MFHSRLLPGFLLICLALGLLTPVVAVASISISPAYLNVDLSDRNPSGTFTVSNLSDQPARFRAKAIYFHVGQDGSIQPTQPDKYSLANWIKFNPREFTLPAKAKRKVRFSIIKRLSGEPRAYWGAIEFTPLTESKFSADTGERTMQFKVVTKILVPIYGTVSGIAYAGNVSALTGQQQGQQVGLSSLIENTGDGILRLTGDYTLSDSQTGAQVLSIPISTVVVFPQEKRRLKGFTEQTLPAGNYQMTVRLQDERADMPPLLQQSHISIP